MRAVNLHRLLPLLALMLLCRCVTASAARSPSPVGAYTNHAGEVIVGRVISVRDREMTLRTSPAGEVLRLPLSIFPKGEQRRICAQTESPRLPDDIRSAYEGYRNMVNRSQQRAKAGLCTQEESDRIIRKANAVFSQYLSRALHSGKLLPEEERQLRTSLIPLSAE